MNTHYMVLQVTENALPEVIEAAWKALMKKYHPDANPGVDPRVAQAVNAAHDILSNPEMRQRYDVWLAAQRNPEPQVYVIMQGFGFAGTRTTTGGW